MAATASGAEPMPIITRRSALALGSSAVGALLTRPWAAQAADATPGAAAMAWPTPLADGESESHGLSAFGELALPADFAHLPYADPEAPKGGTIVLEPTSAGLNQNFTTFDTLNIYILRGDGAAGMGLIFDSLMGATLDESDALYGLVAKSVRWSADRLTYRFLLRPEARFHDGSRLTAADAAFTMDLLKTKGHPNLRTGLRHLASATALADDLLEVKLDPARTRETHLTVAGLPIFSKAYYTAHSFDQTTLDPPLGSSAYRVGAVDQGRTITFNRVKDYWAKDLPLNRGQGNFDTIRYEYYRERQVGFEAFKSGATTYHEDCHLHQLGQGLRFSGHRGRPGETRRGARRGTFRCARVVVQHAARQVQGPRASVRPSASGFDFQWVDKNIMYGLYARTVSYFQNSPLAASGMPGPDELALLEPFRGKVPDSVFGEAILPPVSDGSGQDRALLGQAFKLLQAAGCKRDGNVLKLPSGEPFRIEFLDFSGGLERAHAALHQEPSTARHRGQLPHRGRGRNTSLASTTSTSTSSRCGARRGDPTPGEGLRVTFGSEAAHTPGSQTHDRHGRPRRRRPDREGAQCDIPDGPDHHLPSARPRAAARAITGCRCGTTRPIGSPTGMNFGWPKQRPKLDPGVLSTWWYDDAKASQLKQRG